MYELYSLTWLTRARISPEEILSPEEFNKRCLDVVTAADPAQLESFIEEFTYTGVTSQDYDDDEQEEYHKDLIESVMGVLTPAYLDFHGALTNHHRCIDFRNIGDVTVWFTGGLTNGDYPWDGMNDLNGLVSAATYYIDGVWDLVPYILTSTPEGSLENSEEPVAVGMVTSHADSIMKHSALTHPDPDVRSSIVANESVVFTASELATLACDKNEQVALEASKRLVNAAG